MFKIHDQGPTELILGVKLERDRPNRTIWLSQRLYIENILERYNMIDRNPVATPMTPTPLSNTMVAKTKEEQNTMDKTPYREAVGKLLYLAIATRPDIAYAVGVLCRFNSSYGPEHWKAVKHLLRYLKGTIDLRLQYSPSNSSSLFSTYCDADLGGNIDNSRSTSGYVIQVGTGSVLWGSRLQRHVALSSTESEYTTASAVGCETMWMRYFFEEIGYNMDSPSPIFVDNASAILVAKNPEHQGTMKHVHRAYNWIRERVHDGDLVFNHVPGSENVADIFTKPLTRPKFVLFRSMLGLV